LTLLIVSFFGYALATCPESAVGVKLWSSTATWPSAVLPTANSNLTILAGDIVVVDTVLPVLDTIVVSGTLIFRNLPAPQTISFKRLIINAGGAVRADAADCRIVRASKITFNFVAVPADQDTSVWWGYAGLANLGGVLDLWGEEYDLTWTRLAATAARGATQLVLADSVGWQIGHEIVIASTDFSSTSTGPFVYPQQSEKRTITGVSTDAYGHTVLALDSPLVYMHWGVAPEAAEIGLLSRSIVMQGAAGSDTTQFGGHVIMGGTNTGLMTVTAVEFVRMGQRGVLARYPIHWHRLADRIGFGDFVTGCSFHQSYQRCVTVHDTRGILVKDNVAFNITGHCYFLEDASESFNTFDHNLGVLMNPGPMIPTDQTPAVFWMTNLNNTWVNNAAVEGHFGFWASLPDYPIGPSTARYSDPVSVLTFRPIHTPLKLFSNNVAHSNLDSGLFIDEFVKPDGTTDLGNYHPYLPPYNGSEWQLTEAVVQWTDSVFYKNRQHGIWSRASRCEFTGMKLLDNLNGINLVPGPQRIRDSEITCETSNIGFDTGPSWLPSYGGRSRPVPWSNAEPLCGYELYDAGGDIYVDRITFKNCARNTLRPASAVCYLGNSKNVQEPGYYLSQVSFVSSQPFYFDLRWNQTTMLDGPRTIIVQDVDGSATGVVGGVVTSNGTFTEPEGALSGCVPNADWQAQLCPPYRDPFTFVSVTNLDPASTNFAGTNVVPLGGIRHSWYNLGSGRGEAISRIDDVGMPHDEATRTLYRGQLFTRRTYAMRFINNHPTPPKLKIQSLNLAKGDWVVVAIPYPRGTTFDVQYDVSQTAKPMTAATSAAGLALDKYYYDSVSQHLLIRMYQWQQNTNNFWNKQFYDSWGIQVSVTASCGSACSASDYTQFPAPVLPPLFGEEAYRADLSACSTVPPTTSPHSGTAFFWYSPSTHVLHYHIRHTVPGEQVTMMHIHLGSESTAASAAPVIFTLEQFSSSHGEFALTHAIEEALYKGQLFVNSTPQRATSTFVARLVVLRRRALRLLPLRSSILAPHLPVLFSSTAKET